MALRALLKLSLLLLAGGCSSDDPTVKETHAFIDDAGRSCEATLERTSDRSPVVSSAVACDSTARECPSSARPCFQLSVRPEGVALLNCPACCLGASSRFSYDDCSGLTCESDADCVYGGAECTDGTCTCPSGRCE